MGLGTRETIEVMRMPSEKAIDHDNELFVCFVDFEKAFDRVEWKRMLNILKDLGVDWRDRRLICELYLNQQAVVRLGNDHTENCEVGRGVRQGCLLSPILFSIYVERMMLEAMDSLEEGVLVGARGTDTRCTVCR